ncbi:MAG: radical SAM protein [Methyloligellaceae bacterium]
MNKIDLKISDGLSTAVVGKFTDPDVTANGERRASVALRKLETLWINTGTLCNIECVNCYMESSPTNDRLTYISAPEVTAFFDEIEAQKLGTREIAFTGGEPFMNPDFLTMLSNALECGYDVLVLTNAMQPMQRPRIKKGLLALKARFAKQLTLRVSLDHYGQEFHEIERGPRTWQKTLDGLDWLSAEGFQVAIAGRTCWGETEAQSRAGFAKLIETNNWPIDPQNRSQLVLLPEMDEKVDVPEITTACWGLLNISPDDIMCATSRMVVKRKGAAKPTVVPCTLLPHNTAFEMGATLEDALTVDGGMFDRGAVKLCHPHCSKFCVLGGGSCTGS